MNKKQILAGLVILTLVFLTLPVIAKEYKIVETNQALKGYYKQQMEAQKLHLEREQIYQANKDASDAYLLDIEEYDRWLKRQVAMQQFYSAMAVTMQGVANGLTEMQALEQKRIQAERAAYKTTYKTLPSSINNAKKSIYTPTPKSNNGYPIIDPYADPNYWQSRGW